MHQATRDIVKRHDLHRAKVKHWNNLSDAERKRHFETARLIGCTTYGEAVAQAAEDAYDEAARFEKCLGVWRRS